MALDFSHKDVSGRVFRKGDFLVYAENNRLVYGKLVGLGNGLVQMVAAVKSRSGLWTPYSLLQPIAIGKEGLQRTLILHASQVPLEVGRVLNALSEEVAG